jgi:hypothetical protein
MTDRIGEWWPTDCDAQGMLTMATLWARPDRRATDRKLRLFACCVCRRRLIRSPTTHDHPATPSEMRMLAEHHKLTAGSIADLVSRRRGYRPSVHTISRWMRFGVAGVKLGYTRVGGGNIRMIVWLTNF